MNVLVSGSTGLIGSALTPLLQQQGFTVVSLSRSNHGQPGRVIAWDPQNPASLSAGDLEGVDAVVHLAGESIVGRWTTAKKARIKESRARGTRTLAGAVAQMPKPPHVFVSASAIGYYGDRPGEILDEQSQPGEGFLAEVAQAWEAAAKPVVDKGIRTVHLRIGVVLSKRGGALQKMLLPFQLGLGGPLGSGKQYWSWIMLEDVVDIIQFALTHEKVCGAVNATTPNPVTNAEFTKALASVLRRPAFMPVPRLAARLGLGEMADALLFASTRVLPKQLVQSGYCFRFPELDPALRYAVTH